MKLEAVKTIGDLITYYEGIPEERWTIGENGVRENKSDCYCALGHLGMRDKGPDQPLSSRMAQRLGQQLHISSVNDGQCRTKRFGVTPKRRRKNWSARSTLRTLRC